MLRFLSLALFPLLPALGADLPLLDVSRLELKYTRAETARYKGSAAIKLEIFNAPPEGSDGFAVIKGTKFHNGAIDLDVAGAPEKSAEAAGARGFIGVNFRVQGDRAHWENIYIRPTNGRAPDQLRRNHSTQYTSYPDWPWDRLRKETPGLYESYADMVAGEWTHLRVVVEGTDASLYVGGAEQPCLLVHDLKLGDVEGSVALWIGPGTEGYFRNINVSTK
jgi:hypothetical protein